MIDLRICDGGPGLPNESNRVSMRLTNIRYRAKEIGASVEWSEAESGGCQCAGDTDRGDAPQLLKSHL